MSPVAIHRPQDGTEVGHQEQPFVVKGMPVKMRSCGDPTRTGNKEIVLKSFGKDLQIYLKR